MNVNAEHPSPPVTASPLQVKRKPGLAFLCCVGASALLLSCSDPSGPSGEKLSICHLSGTVGSITEIFSSELPLHQSHGDYVARLVVDKNSTVSDSTHFKRIGDAIAAASAIRVARNETSTASCRITIAVGSGTFQGSTNESADPTFERFPLVIDVPDITLQGSFKMQLDANLVATGAGQGAGVTTLVASPGLITQNLGGGPQNNRAEPIIVVNAHPEGSRGFGIIIEGFVFKSGNDAADAVPGGHGVFALRVLGLVVRGNRFEGGFSESMDFRATSARVERNHLSGRGGSCGICLAGPGDYQVQGNRQMGPGGIPGILITPTTLILVPPMVEQYVLPPSAVVTATVTNNEIRNHQAIPVGVGLRVGAIGVGAPNVIGTTRVVASDNTLVNNRFAMIIEAAFPVANTGLRGDINVTLDENTMTGSCQTNLLVTLSRHTTGLGLNSLPYLRNSTYNIALGRDIPWQDVWYAHAAGNGNTLIVDGQTIPNGSRTAYDASRVCSP